MEMLDKNLMAIGIHTAEILSSSEGMVLKLERACKYLFEQLKDNIDRLRIYLCDEKCENLQEEVMCIESGIQQGSDLIPFYQLPEAITEDGQIVYINDTVSPYLLIPLKHNGQMLGLLEMGIRPGFDVLADNTVSFMADAISLGMYRGLLMQRTMMEKMFFGVTVQIANHMQTINDIDELMFSFVGLTARYFKFDRASVFIFEDDGTGIAYYRSCDFNGNACFLKEIPELPDLSGGPRPLEYLVGYWFPLRTNTRTVGAALFDNIYSSYDIPERLVEILLPLCSQFASAVENIRLFSSIKDSAQRDKLTGLFNRAFFEEELTRLDTRRQLPLSIIIGDLNGLKITNDVFGHMEGDNILKSIAAILKKSCRSEDIIARWGGDEFIILLPQTPVKRADEICERIRNTCSSYDNTKVQLSISLGHATKESPSEDIMQVLKNAEDRMYRHKLLESKSYRSSFVSSLKETLLEKCQETSEHIERIDQLSVVMGTAMGLSDNELDELKLLAMLHDIGKVAISDSILNKPGKLTGKEWEEMKMHSEIGYRIAQSSSELSQIADYILCHHERWDGTGYPLGKKGTEIPKLSRIISVIDAYDVMTHTRSYKTAMTHKEAAAELLDFSGTQFDPEIVSLFLRLYNAFFISQQ